MKNKVGILNAGATVNDIPGKEAGSWCVWGSTEGLFMAQSAYNAIKKHFQEIKFRPGDTIQNCKEPGRLLIVVDHNHIDYFCIDSFGANVNFPFHEAQKLSEPGKEAAKPLITAGWDVAEKVPQTIYVCRKPGCYHAQVVPAINCPVCRSTLWRETK